MKQQNKVVLGYNWQHKNKYLWVHTNINKLVEEKRQISHTEELEITYVDTMPLIWGAWLHVP